MKWLGLDKSIEIIVDTLIAWSHALLSHLPHVIVSLIVAIIFFFLARFVRRLLLRYLKRVSDHQVVSHLIANIAYSLVIVGGIFVILGVLKLDRAVTSLLAGAGILGVALGFAFKDIAANYISGILVALMRPFDLGDVVETDGFLGRVHSIGLWKTVVETFDGQHVMIPNELAFSKPLVNYTRSGRRRVVIEVGVTYSAELPHVERVTRKALETVSQRLEEVPVEVHFFEFGSSSINLHARVWVPYAIEPSSYLQARHEMVLAIKAAYDREGITIPFPIRTLDFGDDGPPELVMRSR